MNTILTLKYTGTNTTSMNNCAKELDCGNSLMIRDIVLCNLSIKEMTLEIKAHEDAILELGKKILFCQAVGTEEYDEDTFKVYTALQVINSCKSDTDKSREIAKLLNN